MTHFWLARTTSVAGGRLDRRCFVWVETRWIDCDTALSFWEDVIMKHTAAIRPVFERPRLELRAVILLGSWRSSHAGRVSRGKRTTRPRDRPRPRLFRNVAMTLVAGGSGLSLSSARVEPRQQLPNPAAAQQPG
jgi:hypothetical protein